MNPTPALFSDLKRMVSDSMSLSFEAEGFSPLVGRIFGLLLFAPEPLSLQQIAEQLGVTKAAVSVQVRTLEKNAMCLKLPTASDRKDYYYIGDDMTAHALRASKQKIEQVTTRIEKTYHSLMHIGSVSEEERSSWEAGLRRFKESAAMYRLILTRLEGIEDEWLRMKEQLDTGD